MCAKDRNGMRSSDHLEDCKVVFLKIVSVIISSFFASINAQYFITSRLNSEVIETPNFPDEIILKILGYIPDISTLFEIAWDVNESFLGTPYWRCRSPFVTRHPLQMQRLIRFIISQREKI